MWKKTGWMEAARIAFDRRRKLKNKEHRRKLHVAGIWVTREGYHIPVAELDDDHLKNIIRLLLRAAEREAREIARWYASCPEPRGEMAQDAFDQEHNYWLGDGNPVLSILTRQAIWPHLIREVEKRRIIIDPRLVESRARDNTADSTQISARQEATRRNPVLDCPEVLTPEELAKSGWNPWSPIEEEGGT